MSEAVTVALVGAGSAVAAALLTAAVHRRATRAQQAVEKKRDAGTLAMELVNALQREVAKLKEDIASLQVRHVEDMANLKREHQAQIRLMQAQLDSANAAYHGQVAVNAELQQKVAVLEREREERA